jgi:hypothetical protein
MSRDRTIREALEAAHTWVGNATACCCHLANGVEWKCSRCKMRARLDAALAALRGKEE